MAIIRKTLALISMVLVALACGLPSNSISDSVGTDATASAPTATMIQAPTAVQPLLTESLSAAETNTDVEPPPTEESSDDLVAPASGYVDALYQGMDAGDWTYEEGLVAILNMMAGEIDPARDDIPRVVNTEGTGIVAEARRYLQEGQDEQVKVQIQRLLNRIAPPIDRILPYARLEDAQSTGPNPRSHQARVAMTASDRDRQALLAAQDEKCAELWAKGFPPGSNLTCFLYKKQELGAYTGRVFYPSSWSPGGPEWKYRMAAVEAIEKAWNKFSEMGDMAAIDLVFVIESYDEDPDVGALAEYETESSCLLVVFPSLIQEDQKNPTGSVAQGLFRQVLAHELFHCFQNWNLPGYKGEPKVTDWWAEGSAQYFSNVVYNGVNVEWDYAMWFDMKSESTPMFYLSYENFEFFQYLANQLGDNGVIALLQSLPLGGEINDQVAAVSAFPNMEALYHDFGRSYITHGILDSSSETDKQVFIPNDHLQTTNIKVGASPHQTIPIEASTFTIMKRVLIYQQEQLYDVQVTETDSNPEGLNAAWIEEPGVWTDIPPEIVAACDPVWEKVLLTSTAPSLDVYKVELEIGVQEKLPCDACLIGSWELDNESFTKSMLEVVGSDPGFPVDNIIVSGGIRYTFTSSGAIEIVHSDFTYEIDATQLNEPLGNDIHSVTRVNSNGVVQGRYFTDGAGNFIINSTEGSLDFRMMHWMNDQLLYDGPLLDEMDFSPSMVPVPYQCTPTTLTIDIIQSQAPPWTYNKIP
jgi:hypothetical protein